MRPKAKGNAFERKIANLLSARFVNHTGIKQAFRRNASSGAFFGGKNQRRAETHDMSRATFGDIVTPGDFKYTIECKHYRDAPSFGQLVAGKCAMLDTWIEQAGRDAATSGLKPVIIAKFNRVAEAVMVRRDDHEGDPAISYRGWAMLSLTDWLAQDDAVFFTSLSTSPQAV